MPEDPTRMADQRKDPRADLDVEVHYQSAPEFLSAYSRNISGGGIFIKTPHPLPLNKTIRLRFTLPGMTRRFESTGIVVWSNPVSSSSFLPSGMGIKFLDLDPEARQLIADFVKANAPATVTDKEP